MTVDTGYKSGKSERDENFPVASLFVAPRFRAPILAFYRFARAADDAADSPSLDATSKLAILSALEDTLLGRSDAASNALPLRAELRAQRTYRATRTRTSQSLSPGRYENPVRHLGRAHRILPLFGDARRAICSRRTRRGAIDVARRPTHYARRCRSSIIFRIAAKTIANSTASTSHLMLWLSMALTLRPLRSLWRHQSCWPVFMAWPTVPPA